MLSRRILRSAFCGITHLHREQRRLPRLLSPFPATRAVVDLHTGPSLAAKLFKDSENQHAHEVLEQSLKPYQLFSLQTTEANAQEDAAAHAELSAWLLDPPAAAQTSADEVLREFRALRRYCVQTETCISDDRFAPFTQLFCAVSHRLSDEQLLEALRELARFPNVASVKVSNFVTLWNTLDVECCRRVDSWRSDQLLLVSDAWYALDLARISEFVWEALRKLGRKVRRMRPEQLVQAMFLCNVLRRSVFDMFEFEANLARCVNEMTLQELGVMSMGFFKTQTPIRNGELLAELYRRLGKELDTVEDITLVAILKVLRYSSKLPQVDSMMQLLDKLCPQVERLSLLSCLHVALLGSDIQCCHEEVTELVLQRFKRDIAQARLKDIERICFMISVFNYHSPAGVELQLCEQILTVLHGKFDEIMKHPRCFPTCLHFLTLSGFYDAEMISSVLDARYIRHAYGKNSVTIGRELFHLDSFVRINLVDTAYDGHQLTDKQRRTMGKMLSHYIPERNSKFKLNNTDRILLEIKESTDSIFRPSSSFKHVLPHYERPDVVVCYDSEQRKALPLSPQCPEDYSGVILTRSVLLGDLESDHIDTVVIVVAGWNNVVRGKNRNTGLFEMKLKQLQMLGHKYVVIYWHEWRAQETQKDRQNFLKRKLATVVKF